MNPVPIDALQRAVPAPVAGPAPAGGFLSFRLARRVLSAILRQLLLWQERASQRHHLATAEEHMLRDVGLRRADVEPEIRKPFWRP